MLIVDKYKLSKNAINEYKDKKFKRHAGGFLFRNFKIRGNIVNVVNKEKLKHISNVSNRVFKIYTSSTPSKIPNKIIKSPIYILGDVLLDGVAQTAVYALIVPISIVYGLNQDFKK